MNTLSLPTKPVACADWAGRMGRLAAGTVLALQPLIVLALPSAAELAEQSLPPGSGLVMPVGSEASPMAYNPWLAGARPRVELGLSLATQRAIWLESGGSPYAYRLNPWTNSSDAPVMVLALRYNMSARSRLYVESGVSTSTQYGPQPTEPGVRVGFEFKSAPRSTFGLSGGNLVRMQLQPGSDVSLRLRGGRVGVNWRYQF